MPDEYISREAALMKLMQYGCSAKNLQSISDMLAADVAPVRHGDGRNTMGPIKGSTTVPSAKGKLSITRKMER